MGLLAARGRGAAELASFLRQSLVAFQMSLPAEVAAEFKAVAHIGERAGPFGFVGDDSDVGGCEVRDRQLHAMQREHGVDDEVR